MARKSITRLCGSADHVVDRRGFLRTLSASSVGVLSALNALQTPAASAELKKKNKRVIVLWLAGGASQLETWDPKPGRPTGGPYRAIPTNIPGIHISELMPKMAQRMQHTAIIRSLNTQIADHGGGSVVMLRGRRDEAAVKYPTLGAIISHELGRRESDVPDNVNFYFATEGRRNGTGTPGFLGARHAPMFLTDGMMPPDVRRLETITPADLSAREDLRRALSSGFMAGRVNNSTGSHGQAYSRVAGLMASSRLFDVSREPKSVQEQYGPTQFAEQCLCARRLVEAGVPYVRVGRAWWDSHGQNFETHLELVTELDHVMSTLIDDLKQRGLLDSTLVITMSEFGRTPNINPSLGRDHFARAWSVSLTGCGIRGGSVYGKTDQDGQHVKDGEVGAKHLYATIFSALGIDYHKEYYLGPRPVPITEEDAHPITEVLA